MRDSPQTAIWIFLTALSATLGCAGSSPYGGRSSSGEVLPYRSSATHAAPRSEASAAPSRGYAEEPPRAEGLWDLVLEDRYQPSSSILTAATVADVDRRAEYISYLSRHMSEGALLNLDLSRRVRFRVVDSRGWPVNDAEVLIAGISPQIAGRTHADGVWDFIPSLYGIAATEPISALVRVRQTVAQVAFAIPPAGDGPEMTVQLPLLASQSRSLDLGFLIDVTGSMEDELRYVNHEVSEIVRRIEVAAPQVRVRVGATLYRDRSDPVPLQVIPFTTDVETFARTLSSVSGQGGGDYPEDMNAGLDTALHSLEWTDGPAVRVLVLVADAPPQFYPQTFNYRDAMLEASQRGIRILPVAASGADRTVEFLFRAIGSCTSTPYVTLTDHSGVGGSHLPADTAWAAVELFNDLLTRLVIADLAGQGMHDPDFQSNAVALYR